MVMRRVVLSALISTSVSLPYVFVEQASAEAPSKEIGRLPDGRAYRIDNRGFQLIDHIAELEVTVDDLQRRLGAAEKMNAGKNIDELCASTAVPLNLKIARLERELSQKPSAATPSPQIIPQSCENETRPLREQISRLQTQISAAPDKEEFAARTQAAENLEARVESKDEELQALRAQLEDTQVNLARADKQLQSKLAREQMLSDQLASTQAKLEMTQDELQRSATLRADIEEARNRMEDATAERERHERELARASMKSDDEVDEIAFDTDPDTLRRAKAGFQRNLHSIQGLVLQRKNLFDSMKAQKRGISVAMRPLATREGKSLDAIRIEVSKLNQESDLGGVARDIREIEQILSDDIATARRVMR